VHGEPFEAERRFGANPPPSRHRKTDIRNDMQRSRFTVPAADRIADPETAAIAADAGEWIAQLPYADLDSVASSMLRALTLLNRHPDKLAARSEIMSAFRVPCGRLIRTVPDKPKAPSSDLMRQLMLEMAYGYKHLVNDALTQRGWLQHRKRLGQSLYFAAKYLSLEMFLGFEAYQCQPGNSWREMLALYLLAEQQNLHHMAVEDRDQPNPANVSISHAFKRIVLLKLQDPCHLMPGEARACFDYVNEIASQALLEEPSQTPNPAGRYLLDFEGVEPPRPPDPSSFPDDHRRYRCLNLIPISHTVQNQMLACQAQGSAPSQALLHVNGLSPERIMKRMLQSWHAHAERRSEREETFGWVLCGSGLAAVNHFLAAPAEAAHEEEDEEEVDLQQISTLAGQPVGYGRIRCRQINRSTGGMCIRVQIPSSAEPKVGQVLLLQEERADGSGAWFAGIVRRRTRIDAESVEAGVQFIRGKVRPIAVKPRGEYGDSRFQPAIWVEREDTRHSSVLVGSGQYQRAREFVVKDAEPGAVIRADQLVESTPSFERFRFLVV